MGKDDVILRAIEIAHGAYWCYKYYRELDNSEEPEGGFYRNVRGEYLGNYVGLAEAIGVMKSFEDLIMADFCLKCSQVISDMRKTEKALSKISTIDVIDEPYQAGKDRALERVDYQLQQLKSDREWR